MEYLCHTYLDKTKKTKSIINFNFLCVVVQHQGQNSNKLVESTDHLCKLKKVKKQKGKNWKKRVMRREPPGLKKCGLINKPKAVKKVRKAVHLDWKLRELSTCRAQLSSETPQRQSLRLERARTNFRERLSHETQDRRLLKLAKMRSNFKAQLSHETQERKCSD